ncbi:GntR family transcriptional regulator [uncultured Ruthenibacterium sp.]|uniref:GntR family transcriptional regulator n=1 Tax=uncultured Ruthenibacterium sp. TaxID=1905347 RepID=UPI00349E5297
MTWNIQPDRPVYLQLIEQLELALVTGEYPPGARMPAVRELAAQAGVNPNTMQRALQELEIRGLVNTQRTSGRTVTQDAQMLIKLREKMALTQVAAFWENMKKLGLSGEEIVQMIQRQAKEE